MENPQLAGVTGVPRGASAAADSCSTLTKSIDAITDELHDEAQLPLAQQRLDRAHDSQLPVNFQPTRRTPAEPASPIRLGTTHPSTVLLAIPMSMFSLTIDATDTGPLTEPELIEWLEGYRAENPADQESRHVQIREMPQHGTVGHHRSVWDFVTRPGAQ